MIMALIATAIGLWLLLQFAKRKLKKGGLKRTSRKKI
jgi:hypothetical protein